MSKFFKKPRSARSLNSLPDGSVVYASREGNVARWLISASVPGMERMVRPDSDDLLSNDLSVEEFLGLEWSVEYALEPSIQSLIELALASSKIRFEAERASEQDIWMGEKLPDIDAWLDDAVRAFNAANE